MWRYSTCRIILCHIVTAPRQTHSFPLIEAKKIQLFLCLWTAPWRCYDMFVNCSCVDTQWQQHSTHLHTNSTQNNTMKHNTKNRTYLTIRVNNIQNTQPYKQWHKRTKILWKKQQKFIWSLYLLITIDTLFLRLSLHFTTLHFTSLHLTLHFFPFKLHPTTLHFSSLQSHLA